MWFACIMYNLFEVLETEKTAYLFILPHCVRGAANLRHYFRARSLPPYLRTRLLALNLWEVDPRGDREPFW